MTTSGRNSRTMLRSNGLSSRNTSESKPMFNVFWTRRMLSALLSQLATKTEISSSFRTMWGCSRNGRIAAACSFLLTTARMIPRRLSSRMKVWKATKASPSSNSPSAMPSRPSSPITPPHSVLSRSRTTHFAIMPEAANIVSSRDWARRGRCSNRQGVFAMFHIRASSHCARPTDAARKSTSFKSTFLASRALTASR